MFDKKYLIFSLFLIVLVIVFIFVGYVGKNSYTKEAPIENVSSGGWVEVVSGNATILNSKDGGKELLTGDVVLGGDEIEISKDGKLSIHLFDGSVLRASDGARFMIKNAEYNKSSGKLVLEASLSNGKIWSKIIELATPDSIWKVETSNTVATVRGSAFGISTDGKLSEVVGSQHKVYVDLIDPISKRKVKSDPVVIEEDSFLVISNDAIKMAMNAEEKISSTTPAEIMALIKKETENLFVSKKKTEDMKKEGWVKDNEANDVDIEKDINIIKEETKNTEEGFKKTLNKKVENALNEIKNKRKGLLNKKDNKNVVDKAINTKIEELSKKDVENKVDVVKKKNIEVTKEEVIKKEEEEKQKKWISLRVETLSDIVNIAEGEMISFRAILKDNNGEEKDVTREAKWQVVGQIGIMDKPGTFASKLDPTISELGEGFGYVIATWQGDNTEQFLGKSGEVHVMIKAEEGPVPEEMLLTQ